jgi:hypothetical protein
MMIDSAKNTTTPRLPQRLNDTTIAQRFFVEAVWFGTAQKFGRQFRARKQEPDKCAVLPLCRRGVVVNMESLYPRGVDY